jgi:CheY-like chemotaxis protein
VIDDIDTNLEIVEAYLQDNGYHVDCVGSGLDGIQLLGSAQYDLILMDIQMPIMDGIAATKRIRALAAPICDIPIIAMTGNVLPQQVKSFLEAGMNDHVGKPIQRTKLYNNVLRWLPKTAPTRERIDANSEAFDHEKLEEFILAVGAEKATRIAQKFLASFDAAFKSTLVDAQREAHDLINAAGVLGLDRFVESCRQAIAFKPSDDPEPGCRAMDTLRAAQSDARQTCMIHLLPKLSGEPLRATG